MKKFTEKDLMQLNPCHDGLKFAKSCNFDFAKVYDTCQRGDWMIWLLRKSKAIDKPQAVLIACECADRVLEIYEKKHSKDSRPRQAIKFARKWAKNPTEENRIKCKTAARAAYGAAYSAYAAAYAAAAAAAYAAYAAYADAAYADAYADCAAAYAVDAAYADGGAARTTERKWQADKIREFVPNPFK